MKTSNLLNIDQRGPTRSGIAAGKRSPVGPVMLLVAASALLFVSLSALADPIVDYQFNGNFDDSAFGSSNTVHPACPADPCNETSVFDSDSLGTFWQWTSSNPGGGGFTIRTNTELGETYTIKLRFSFDGVSGFNKIIDFKNRSSDDGLYFFSGSLDFFPLASAEDSFAAGEVLDLTIARDGASDEVLIVVDNGDLQFGFTDTGQRAVAELVSGESVLGFFHDDTTTSGEGTPGGKVYSLQIFDTFVSLFKDGFEQ